MIELVLASLNGNKVREFKEMLKSYENIDTLSLHQFPDYIPPEETGTTFEENAILKAEHAAKALNKWVLADDSGLVVPALKGEPGVYSRRYSGLNATDVENNKKLLRQMSHLREIERSAYYECALALANPNGLVKCVRGICEGFILTEERGRNGFGYDSLFVKNDYKKTFAELEGNVKNLISHRRKAFERMLTYIETIKDLK